MFSVVSVCLSATRGRSHVTITHDALDFTVQGPCTGPRCCPPVQGPIPAPTLVQDPSPTLIPVQDRAPASSLRQLPVSFATGCDVISGTFMMLVSTHSTPTVLSLLIVHVFQIKL